MEALTKDMAESSMTSFYNLCRAILITSEADFDKFDEVFIEYFEGISTRGKTLDEMDMPEQMNEDVSNWLYPDGVDPDLFYSEEHMEIMNRLLECIERIMQKLRDQQGEFVGNCEVCTGCGLCARGLGEKGFDGVGGKGVSLDEKKKFDDNALSLAKERRFRDFREDSVLDVRQYHVAFRKLRQYSNRIQSSELELDIDDTINKTSKNAGLLHIVFRKPRKNTIKLIVLFDSDGSMNHYSELSSRIFQAVNREHHFKDLVFYYFHNCIYDRLYLSPECIDGDWIDTEHVMRTHDAEYRVIYIADASMADSELYDVGGNVLLERSNRLPGIEWLQRLRRRYNKSVCLNPIPATEWTRLYGGKTIQAISKVFPMYELTVSGLEKAIKKLI